MTTEDMRALLEAASAAVLTVYRANGTAYLSPVWFHVRDDSIELEIADGHPKIESLRRDPRCVFMAFETSPPFRGLRIESDAQLSVEGVAAARLAIASRYLGDADGRRYVEQRTKPGTAVRLPLAVARTWDLRAILPSSEVHGSLPIL